MRTLPTLGTIGACLIVLSGGQAAAQATDQRERDRFADQLEATAVSLHERPNRLTEAARLHVRAASLRALDDPRGCKALTVAAHLLYYAGKRSEATRVMEQAADRALYRGALNIASNAYLMASWIAAKDNRPEEALRLVQHAEVLARSPVLAAAEREQLTAAVRRTAALLQQ